MRSAGVMLTALLMAICADAFAAPLDNFSGLQGRQQGIYVDIDTYDKHPTVRSYFFRTVSGGRVEACKFMELEGDESSSERQIWSAAVDEFEGLVLVEGGEAADPAREGLKRRVWVDAEQRVRVSRWVDSGTGLNAFVALYGREGEILAFRRFLNLRRSVGAESGQLICHQTKFKTLPILSRSMGTDAVDIQIRLTDSATLYTLEHNFRMASDSSGPDGIQSQAMVSALKLDGRKAEETLGKGRHLLVAPNPASGNAEIYFRLERAANARLLISDISGKTFWSLGLGELGAGYFKRTLSAGELAEGSYLVVLQSDEGSGNSKREVFKLAVKR